MRRDWCWNWLFCWNDLSGWKTFETTATLSTWTISAPYLNNNFYLGSVYTCHSFLQLLHASILCIRNSKNAVVCVWPRYVFYCWLYTVETKQNMRGWHIHMTAPLQDIGTLPILFLCVIQWLSLNQKETDFGGFFALQGPCQTSLTGSLPNNYFRSCKTAQRCHEIQNR